MKKFNKKAVVVTLFLSLILGISGPTVTFASSTPTLGAATNYAVLSSTYTNTAAGTTITGDLGYTTGPAMAPVVTGTTYIATGTYAQAGIDQGVALTNLNAQTCDFTFLSATDLSLLVQPLTPGVYCVTGAVSVGTGGITLDGAGTYIFRSTGALTTVASAVVSLSGGASVCNVFWTPIGATTLAANTTFIGTVIDDAGVTVGANTTWSGALLAYNGTVTTDTDTITLPTCTIVPASFHIIKAVSGSAVLPGDFNVYLKNAGVNVAGSPQVGAVAPGTLYSLSAGIYSVSEDLNALYTQTFSGDCDISGNITLFNGYDKTCTITNTYVPPGVPLVHHGGSPTYLFTIPAVQIVPPVTAPVATTTTVYVTQATSTEILQIPKLPNTGFPPQGKSTPNLWPVILFGAMLSFVIVIPKKPQNKKV